MTHSSNNNSNRSPKVFGYRRGTEGVDDTFDIVYLPFEWTIAATAYWEEEQQAKSTAQKLVRALNAFHDQGGYVYANWGAIGEHICVSGRFTLLGADGNPLPDFAVMAREAERAESSKARNAISECESRWAGRAFQRYFETAQFAPDNALIRLLADLMHWSYHFHQNFGSALEQAQRLYTKELPEGGIV